MELYNLLTGEVMEGPFATAYHRPTAQEKPIPGSDKPTHPIEPYIPPQAQIKDMMMAGARLKETRRLRFDTETEEEVPLDPTREQGLDIVDLEKAAKLAREQVRTIQERLEKARKAKDDREQPVSSRNGSPRRWKGGRRNEPKKSRNITHG